LPVAIDRWCVVGVGPPGSLDGSIGALHTDYNDGFVLPVAIDRQCVVAAEPTSDGVVRASSRQLDETVTVAADGSTDPAGVEPAWGRFVAGVVRVLRERGAGLTGAELQISSSIP